LQTFHRIIFRDSRQLGLLDDESIDLVVTSPPYPMIEMWDALFASLNPDIGVYLERGDYRRAFESMHRLLDEVWAELYRVMKAGALACINIGDATRSVGDRFQLFANHSRVQGKCMEMGFDVLPSILWRKPTNAPNKFMGSGMLPAGAYVTLEHEYILILRKSGKRMFRSPEEKRRRRESAYFWEERNRWFSDIWDLKGAGQEMNAQDPRHRSAAFPFLLPFRLINMYSLLGDTVLDPFLGTATTTLAAMACGRNSVGCEIDPAFAGHIRRRIEQEAAGINCYNLQRIKAHLEFARSHAQTLKYKNRHYGFPVMTGQEQELKLPLVEKVVEVEENLFKATYLPDDSARDLALNMINLNETSIPT